MTSNTFHRPRLIDLATEGHRAGAEFLGFTLASPYLKLGRSGRGKQVLIIPGLMADERSTRPLRGLLSDVGYRPYDWGQGTDIGPTPGALAGMLDLVDDLTDRAQEPISVIGWSLGGVLARELSLLRPEAVDRVITLGSALSMVDSRQSSASWIYDLFADRHMPGYSFDEWITRRSMPDVPFTSVYTRTDGIVHWESCLVPEGPLSENIEIHASHSGLGANASAAYVVLDRLEASVSEWAPFAAPTYLRAAFPSSPSVPQPVR